MSTNCHIEVILGFRCSHCVDPIDMIPASMVTDALLL